MSACLELVVRQQEDRPDQRMKYSWMLLPCFGQIILLGGNDCDSSSPAEFIIADIKLLLASYVQLVKSVTFIGILDKKKYPELSAKINLVNRVIKDWTTKQENLRFFQYSSFRSGRNPGIKRPAFTDDNIHLTDKAYRHLIYMLMTVMLHNYYVFIIFIGM